MDVTPDQLAALVAWGASEPLIVRIRPFGSRAKGTAHPDSDLDIAVELDASAGVTDETWYLPYLSWVYTLKALVELPIDLWRLNDGAPDVQRYVEETGVVIYTRCQAQL